MNVGATLASNEGGSGPFSRATDIELLCVRRARDRVVGMSRAATAIHQLHPYTDDVPSAPRNSRIPDLRTASPSAVLENGVRPAPFN